MRPQAREAKTGFEKIRTILHREWDPIGCGVPEDEYDSHVWPVLRFLMQKAKREEVRAYLVETANVTIECPVPDERLELVLDKLMALEV
jgi:hypothetical protein